VTNLLQKPSAQEMEEAGALIGGGAALLDTGIFAVKGRAWRDLLGLTALRPNPVDALLASGEEMSLYEEMAGESILERQCEQFVFMSLPLMIALRCSARLILMVVLSQWTVCRRPKQG
jgi:hypothetical protein